MPVLLADVLEDNALVSLDEAKAHCGIVRETTPDDLHPEDARLVEAINWVSGFVDAHVRPMARKTQTLRLPMPRGPVLALKRAPIDTAEAITLSVNDATRTVWRNEADGARSTFDALVHSFDPWSPWSPDGLVMRGARSDHFLYCGCGCQGWGSGVDPNPVLIEYTGGFDCIPADGSRNKLPGDMRSAVLNTVRAWFRNEQQGTTDIVSISQPGGGPTFEVPRWVPYGAAQLFAKHVPFEMVGG